MPLPTVKQLIDGLMVADWNAAATGAVEQAFASAFGVNLNSTASWGLAVAMGNAFGTGSFPSNVDSSTFLNGINFNLTGSGMTIPGELSAFQSAAQQFGLGGAAGILVEAQFLTSSEVGLTAPADVAAWNTQSLTAQNRASVSGSYANATPPNGAATALVPTTIGDPAWVASQTILLGVTEKVATVLGANVQIQAAANPPPGDPSKITGQAPTGFNLTPGIDTPTTGFTTGNGATANAKDSVFNALPFVQTSGLANNTLNTGDILLATGAAVGTTTLNYTASPNGVAANPPFALGVKLDGVNKAVISNQAAGIVAGFQGTVTGLTKVDDTASVFGVKLGGLGQGLNTALTDVNISAYGGPNGTATGPVFSGIIAASKGSATNAINVGITGPLGATTKGGADSLLFTNDGGPGTAGSPNLSYGIWAITTANAVDLELQQGGVGAATALKLSGDGNIAVGQDAIGNWQNVNDIDASGSKGTVIVTGATAGNVTNAHGTDGAGSANPTWNFGSKAGLLDDTGAAFKLTKYELGSGTNILDVSSATAAQVAGLTTTPNALASLTNTIIVQDSVATTTSATTFAGVKGFQTLGIGGPTTAQGAAGTIDMANLTAFGAIDYFTKANGSVTINNQTAALAVNLEDNTTIGQNLTVGNPTGLNDSLKVSVGNSLQKTGDAFNDIKANGDELFTLTSVGAGAVKAGVGNGANDIGGVLLFPTLGGNEQVTIGGDTTLQMAVTHSALGAIQDQNGSNFLNLNNLTVTITNTAATEWGQGVAAPSKLFFATDAGANGGKFAPVINYSNNAVTIDATTSGGLISPWGDANFAPGATAATTFGDVIKGATNPVGYQTGGAGSLVLGDVLAGSIGNDTIISNSTTLPDYIVTGGGADTITLAGGHTGADHVAFYAANGNVNAGAAYAVGSVKGAISEGGVGAFEFANPGYWGIGGGGSSTRIDDGAAAPPALFTDGHGTTAAVNSNSTVTNFNPSQDFLDFSVKAWSTTGLIGTGLTQDSGALATITGAGNVSATGVGAHAVSVAPGGSIVGTAGTPTNLIILSQGTFLDANAVAGALHAGGSYNLTHSALGATVEADFLLAYAGTDGNAHIANLHLAGNGASTHTFTDFVTASDMVTLVGVNINQVAANADHIHFVA